MMKYYFMNKELIYLKKIFNSEELLLKSIKYCKIFLEKKFNEDSQKFIEIFEDNFKNLKFYIERVKIDKKILKKDYFLEVRLSIKNKNNLVLPYFYYIKFDKDLNFIYEYFK